jgi:hypothetical protein
LHVRLRQLASTTALILALSAVPAVEAHAQPEETAAPQRQAQPSASDSVASDLESSVAGTLEANPGSVRTGANTVMLQPGIMAVLPSDGEVGAQHASDCPPGWLCAWPDSDFRGPMLGVRQGQYINYWNWMWHVDGRISPCEGVLYCDGGGWYPYATTITSIFNHTCTDWAAFYSPRNDENYLAAEGAPNGWVGSKYDNSFWSAYAAPQAC